jgi:hypothetical protein
MAKDDKDTVVENTQRNPDRNGPGVFGETTGTYEASPLTGDDKAVEATKDVPKSEKDAVEEYIRANNPGVPEAVITQLVAKRIVALHNGDPVNEDIATAHWN